jgi:hypothetical protein
MNKIRKSEWLKLIPEENRKPTPMTTEIQSIVNFIRVVPIPAPAKDLSVSEYTQALIDI